MKKKTNPQNEEAEKPKLKSRLNDPTWKWSHLDWSGWEDRTIDPEPRTIVVFNPPRKQKKED